MFSKTLGFCLLLQIFAVLCIVDALETFEETEVDQQNTLQKLREKFENIKFDVDRLKDLLKSESRTNEESAIIRRKMTTYNAQLKEILKLLQGMDKTN